LFTFPSSFFLFCSAYCMPPRRISLYVHGNRRCVDQSGMRIETFNRFSGQALNEGVTGRGWAGAALPMRLWVQWISPGRASLTCGGSGFSWRRAGAYGWGIIDSALEKRGIMGRPRRSAHAV
jgi:hypothetical protein